MPVATQAKKQTAKQKDEKATQKVIEIMKVWIDAEAENTAFLVKAHPRGKEALNMLAGKVKGMIENFLVDGKMPMVYTFTEEEAEKASSGFWVNRSEVVSRKRAKA